MELSHLKEVVFEQIQALPGRCEWIFGRKATVSAIVPLCISHILHILLIYSILGTFSVVGSLPWFFFSESLLPFLCSSSFSARLGALSLCAIGMCQCVLVSNSTEFFLRAEPVITLFLYGFGDSNHIFELEIEGGVKTKDIFLFLIYWCQKPYQSV